LDADAICSEGGRQMSELKAYIGPTPDEKGLSDYYLKSEADKVIAELKEKHKTEVKELLCLIRDKENNFNRAFDSVEKELRHHKYKRCLAMAEWCNANCMHTVLLIGHKIMPHWEWRIKTNYWYKWRKIWFELYKKFKEGN
jgi:hypothetical protein